MIIVMIIQSKMYQASTVFHIDNNQQIIILAWFLKDRVTLKTGGMMKFSFEHRNKLQFKMHNNNN